MDQQEAGSSQITRVAFLGNHLPRQCGIATFTTDLAQAVTSCFPQVECGVIAINDPEKRYPYGPQVKFEITQGELASYRRATDFINFANFDVLSVQHEYGIFGGKGGSHVLAVLGRARLPIVTTLHTILAQPSADQRRVLEEVMRLSSRVVVMSRHGMELLRDVHRLPPDKIDLIPHGIPALPARSRSRERLGVDGTLQLLTFGLLSPDKGIEYVLDALPAVVARYPNVMYTIVGATHPHIKERQGEAYRLSLQLRARKLGIEGHVVFHDRFVSATELGEFLAAADVYLTPYLNLEQITSGTLAYAVGTGKATISSGYSYARELLADGRGIVVPTKDAAAIARALERLLSDPNELREFGARALEFGKDMTWPSVAAQYMASFERARQDSVKLKQAAPISRLSDTESIELPELSLRHLRTMTDDTGMLQHARFSVPRYEDGYCTDDNARALLLTALLDDAGTVEGSVLRTLSSRYTAFISHAFDPTSGRFRNFMSYGRDWLEACGSEDSHGRTLWALGTVLGRAREPGRASLAGQLFHAALPAAAHFVSPRAWAFALLGIHEYQRAFAGDRLVRSIQDSMATRLFSEFRNASGVDWHWCEDIVAYENARLPQALVVSGRALEHTEMLATGLQALGWLNRVQRSDDGMFSPVGSNGFYARSAGRASFDQQPVEACATVSACLEAWRATGDGAWIQEMWRAFTWFLGENALQASLYDSTTGGCRDGLHADRLNENQGAESTLSFLLALADMMSLESERASAVLQD